MSRRNQLIHPSEANAGDIICFAHRKQEGGPTYLKLLDGTLVMLANGAGEPGGGIVSSGSYTSEYQVIGNIFNRSCAFWAKFLEKIP